MKKIESIEKVIKNKGDGMKEAGINTTLYMAYRRSQEAGNEFLNFYDVIWETDIEQIVENLKREGVKEFTISSAFSSLIETLAMFDACGCRMDGLTVAFAAYPDFFTGERAVIPAIKMIVE